MPPEGFEPSIFWMRTRYPWPLDDGGPTSNQLYLSLEYDKIIFMSAQEIAIPKSKLLSKETVLVTVAMAIPFVLAGPQWLVGTIVNAILFITAIKLNQKYWLAIAIMPSLAVATRGLIFGPFTWFLIYFMPAIWAGNFLLMYLFSQVKNWKGICISSLIKTLFLFGFANIYFKIGLVPRIFLQTMGIIQFITALSGGIIAIYLLRTVLRYSGGQSLRKGDL